MKNKIKNIARRITGVSTPIGGISWKTDEDEDTIIGNFLLFLEDKRILYDSRTGHSMASHFVFVGLDHSKCLSEHASASILNIREEIGRVIQNIPKSSSNIKVLKKMQATCRWALDNSEKMQNSSFLREDNDFVEIWRYGALDYGMTFLGLFRKKIGQDIKELAEKHQIVIEGPLQKTLTMTYPPKQMDGEIFFEANELVNLYMKRHSGFRDMHGDWFENLCNSLADYRKPWDKKSDL